MDNCIFCKIIRGEMPSHKVYEDDISLAFLDIYGSAPGHLMVILKRHGLSILDYSKEELGELMERVQQLAIKLKKAENADSITIGINHLEKKGVPHLHVHLIPRNDSDGGKVIQSIVSKKMDEPLEQIADRIRNS